MAIGMHTYNPSSQETQTSRFFEVEAGLSSEFQATQGYIVRPCVKTDEIKLQKSWYCSQLATRTE